MIQIKKSKYDNYCTCCRKPFVDSMEVSFSHKDCNDSVNITLCGKCRRELMEALVKADTSTNSEDVADIKSALDNIHNVVAENAYNSGYDAGYKEGYEQGKKDAAVSASMLAKRLMTKFDDVLSVADVLEELKTLETIE